MEALRRFHKAKILFDQAREKEEGGETIKKVVDVINELGQNWSTFNGADFSERQMKLAGYRFYLAEYTYELKRVSEQLKLEIDTVWASRWDDITELIKQEKGKVSNKQEIENLLILETKELKTQQILYETTFNKYKAKIDAVDSIIMAVVQIIADKKREIELSKSIN